MAAGGPWEVTELMPMPSRRRTPQAAARPGKAFSLADKPFRDSEGTMSCPLSLKLDAKQNTGPLFCRL